MYASTVLHREGGAGRRGLGGGVGEGQVEKEGWV